MADQSTDPRLRDRHYDLAIIGSGSGNSVITPDLAGWDIAVVDGGTFGGTCLNVGCIPTKMFVYTADVADTIRHASRYGVDGEVTAIRWAEIRDRIFGRIDAISAGGREYRANGSNTTLYQAHATFTGPRTLALDTGQRISADRIVVAAGSRAVIPPEVSGSGVPYLTSDTVMRLETLPRRLAVLGSGFIAAEFAHVFGQLGVEVTVIARGPQLLRHLDVDIAHRFTVAARRQWDVRLDSGLLGVTQDGDGLRLDLVGGTTLRADELLVATGRVANTASLGCAAAGLELHPDGRIAVDEHQRTSVDGVWALGDVSSPYQLKHVANHEMRVVAHNLAHPTSMITTDHRYVPSAVFTHPQLATVGITEQDAAERGLDYVSATHDFGATAYGWAMEDTESFCKLIADRSSGELLGAHLIGPQASTLIQPLIQAMSFGQTVAGLARGQYWIHPALTEVVENALLTLEAATKN
ncbi:MAG TPA: mycothione reductase [Jatrophihabitantaceae bacterium]|jgi:mycothione reductase|nr:mycothione reductase [Jatrophihabitantaceae bacterium]